MTEYSRRFYRETLESSGLVSFTVRVKDSDLWVGVDRDSYSRELPQTVETFLWQQRRLLEEYLVVDPGFAEALTPYYIHESMHAPPLAFEMARAANAAGTGPMAAVAGAFAALVGQKLAARCREVIVENGGDLFLKVEKERRVAVFAGKSPFSGKIALKLTPQGKPLGICTSSGTVGPSLSYGRADACVILSPWVALADAVATATGNRIKGEADLQEALDFARQVEGVEGILLIFGERLAAWGNIEIVPL